MAPAWRRASIAAWAFSTVSASACSRPAPPPPAPSAVQSDPAVVQTLRPLQRGLPTAPRLVWFDAPASGDVQRAVRAQLKKAKAAGQTLLVYVGAAWCEPCEVFHKAAAAGELDERLGTLRVIAFDLDRDRERLEAAGYRSAMIPLFALPREDGAASGRQHGGAVKGREAIDFLVPRLQNLMAQADQALATLPAQATAAATP